LINFFHTLLLMFVCEVRWNNVIKWRRVSEWEEEKLILSLLPAHILRRSSLVRSHSCWKVKFMFIYLNSHFPLLSLTLHPFEWFEIVMRCIFIASKINAPKKKYKKYEKKKHAICALRHLMSSSRLYVIYWFFFLLFSLFFTLSTNTLPRDDAKPSHSMNELNICSSRWMILESTANCR
jgi:hypothetical protein